MEIKLSNRGLWHVITGRVSLQDPEQVAEELKQNKDRLLNGILIYQKKSSSSLDKIKKSEEVKDFIQKLGKFLDLDSTQTLELFGNYLHNDFRGTHQQLQVMLKNDKQTESLMLKILDYYFEERLHILQCIKYLLSYWQDPNHAFREQFTECIDGLQERDALITKIAEQYKLCCTSQIPVTQFPGSLVKTRNYKLALQYLREQILLLEIMLLYYKEFLHPASSLLGTAKLFQSQGFGTRQVNRHVFDARAEALVPQISYLQVLILIESLDLEGLRNQMDEGSFKKHHIVREADMIELLDRLYMSWGDLPQHGPVMLAWAVFRFVTMETDLEQDVRKIGSKALQCHVFEYLDGLLKLEEFSSMTPVANTCKSLVYGLFFVVLALFQEDTLGDIKLLVSVLSQALMEKGLCIDFWDTNLSTGSGLLLKSTANWFPLQFLPLLQLLKSLAGEEESAGKVFSYLTSLPSYTEFLRENKVGDVDCTGDDQVWRIINPKILFNGVPSTEQPIVIARGTLGSLLPAAQGAAVIRWNHRYSGLKLFLFEMDAFLYSVSSGTSQEGERVIAIVDLVNEILKNRWSAASKLEPIISRLHLIIQRCTPSPTPPQELIASCLNCLATVASHDPLQVWFGLQQTGFLPYCTSVQQADGGTTIESLSFAPGNLGAILSAREQPTGHYPVTMATLRLFLQLMCGIGQAHEEEDQPINFLDLAACLVFVLREVFTGFHKWRFTAVKDREEIGQRCLEIFNAVLGLKLLKPIHDEKDQMDMDDTAEAKEQLRSASVLQDVLSHGLLYTNAGQSLLNILCTGVDTVDKLISLGGSTGSHALAVVQLIKLAFSVLSKLLSRKHKDEDISPLEQALSTQVIHHFKDSSTLSLSSPGQSQLVTVIASYIHHRMDSKLPTLATLLLKRLCLVAPMSMYGSFGNEAVPLRDAFVARLLSSKEDLKLKVAILEFIATAVETQPGLIELFLNLTSKKNQEFTLGDHSCLHAVLTIIDPKKQAGRYMPSRLVSAAFMLLHALWFDRRDAALTAIRSSSNFWENLTRPLFLDIGDEDDAGAGPQLQTASYVFQIVALETYYVASGQLDESLKKILKDFASKQRYQYWSKFIKLTCPEEGQPSRMPRPRSPLVSVSNDNEHLKLLRAWRTLLIVAASVENNNVFSLRDSKLRSELLDDTLAALKTQVSRPVSVDVLSAAHELSSLYLTLLRKWKSSLKKQNVTFTTLVEILESANKNDTQLLDHIRIPVFSSISILLQYARSENKSDTLDSSYAMALLPLACEPLEYLNGRLGKQEQHQDRVLELSVFIIDEILNILLSNPGQWLPVLREHALFASLVQALDICVKTREKLDFTEAVLHLFLSLARIPVSAEALAMNNLSQTLCLGVATLFNALDSGRQSELSHQRGKTLVQLSGESGTKCATSQRGWTSVWQLSLAVMASMLRTLRHGFLKEVIDFAGVHREHLALAMDRVRCSQASEVLMEAEEVTAFLLELAHYSKQWRLALPDVLSVLQYRVGVLCQTCIALLTHPRLLAHLLEMSSGNPLHEGSQPLADISLSLSSSFTGRSLLRTYSYADEDTFRNNPVVSSTQSKLLKILCNALAMLRQFTPDICEILLDEGMDIDEYVPILALVFSSPAIDHEEPLSFGTLLACLNMCLTHLSPGDVRSPVKSPVKTLSEALPKSLLMFAMETALVLALSQASRYLRDPTLDPRVKQLLKRELGSELSTFLGGLNRHFIRRGLPPSPLGERASPASSTKKTPTKAPVFSEAPEQRFFKLADIYVKRLLR